MNHPITVQTIISAPISKVWEAWNTPSHIEKWNHAGEDWHCPKAENTLSVGEKFFYTMAAKDGSFEFVFSGTFDDIVPNERVFSTLDDQRRLEVYFSEENGATKLVEIFEPENQNPREMQGMGWQMILDNFKKYVESL